MSILDFAPILSIENRTEPNNGEDVDDDVIVPSRRWSGRGLGEAGSKMPRECRLDFELEGTEYDDAVVDVGSLMTVL